MIKETTTTTCMDTGYGPVSVCSSQIERDGWIDLVFGVEAFFDLSYTVF